MFGKLKEKLKAWTKKIASAGDKEETQAEKPIILKPEKEKEIEKIGWFVSNIADANKEVALKLLSRIDINALLLKIEKEEDIFRIQWCVDNIAEVSKEVAQQIVSSSLKGRRLFRRRK